MAKKKKLASQAEFTETTWYGPTMRQQYKCAALQGMLAHPESVGGEYSIYAEGAGKYADAMLAEDAEHERKSRENIQK